MIKRGPRIGDPLHGGVSSGSFLKRTIQWTPSGFQWIHDPKHVVTIVKACLGEKPPTKISISPASKTVAKSCRTAADPLSEEEKKSFQSIAATALYVAGDRLDIQYAVVAIMRGMANPLVEHWLMLCRLASYLHAHPRMVSRFDYQPMASEVYCEVDADWAGDPKTRRSTDGECPVTARESLNSGLTMWGSG